MKRWLWLALLFATPVYAQDTVTVILPGNVTVRIPAIVEVPQCPDCPDCPPPVVCPPPPAWECPDGWTCTPPPEPEGPTIFATQTASGAERIQERDPGPDTLTAGGWYFRVDSPEWVDLGINYDAAKVPGVVRVRLCRPSGACNTEELYPYELNPRIEQVEPGDVTVTGTITHSDGTTSEVSRTFTVNPNTPPVPPDTTPPVPPDTVPPEPGDTITPMPEPATNLRGFFERNGLEIYWDASVTEAIYDSIYYIVKWRGDLFPKPTVPDGDGWVMSGPLTCFSGPIECVDQTYGYSVSPFDSLTSPVVVEYCVTVVATQSQGMGLGNSVMSCTEFTAQAGVPPDSITFYPMAPPDTINYWTTGWWDDQPYTAWLKVDRDSIGTADLWQAFDPVGNCQYAEGPWVEQFVNVTEVTGSKFYPDLLFFPRYCGPPPEPPDTIAISTPQNLRVEGGSMIGQIAWDRVPEDGQCENSTGHPANCPDVQGDEIYYRVTDVEYWPPDLLDNAGYNSTLMFDTLSAMASTARSFKSDWNSDTFEPLYPDSLRFCVTAEAWDCPTCAGPGGVRSPGNLRGYNPVYYVPISEKACSGMLEVVP